ncbi:MAG: FxsA family protein [Campylobacteraceae bacterium]|nr:FxsA family protein [Campylobacteraceae bacterium]
MKAILFLAYLFVEVYVTITIASEIGFFFTFLTIVFTAIFGIILIFKTPFKIAEIMQNVLGKASSFIAIGISAILRIFAAILLIFPGFFGDILGLILLVVSILITPKIDAYNDKHSKESKNKEEIIDVEIIVDNGNK